MTVSRLREFWEQQTPSCRSCGWAPAFYEIEDDLEKVSETADTETWECTCISKDSEDPGSHRGIRFYVPKQRVEEK